MDYLTIGIFAVIAIIVLYFIFGRKNAAGSLDENDAKRFAGLLISEIKLYENYKVERGLKNNNLYESLKDEIEEARKKYKKRITGSEFEKYFEDALTEVLAGGDKSKLGMISTSLNK
jgi:hypothetical protein